MKTLLPLGLIAAAAYLVYRNMGGATVTPGANTSAQGATAAASSSTSSASTATAAPVVPVADAAATAYAYTNRTRFALLSLRDLLVNAIKGAGLNPDQVTADQISYFYQQLPGRPSISPELYGRIVASLNVSGSSVVSVDQFISALSGVGLGAVVGGRVLRFPVWGAA